MPDADRYRGMDQFLDGCFFSIGHTYSGTCKELHPDTPRITVYPSGAQRHSDAEDVRFDLMPPAALLEIAKVWAEGAVSHGPDNWHNGMPYSAIINHALKHMAKWQHGDRSEPHLAKVAWGMMAIIAFEAEGRSAELNDLPKWRTP